MISLSSALTREASGPLRYSLIRRASIRIVFERDCYLLGHPGLPDCERLSAPYKINYPVTITAPRQPPRRMHHSAHATHDHADDIHLMVVNRQQWPGHQASGTWVFAVS